MEVNERAVQTPCQWCGKAVEQPPTGRLLRYCDRSCRQRAYETRTAARRLQTDVAAGLVRAEPAERIVERVVQKPAPRTAGGWVKQLQQLHDQLRDGRIKWWDAERLRQAIAAVDEQLQALESRTPPPAQQTYTAAGPPRWYAPEPFSPRVRQLLAAVDERIRKAGGSLPGTLQRLAADFGVDVDELRQALLQFENLGFVQARRMGEETSLDELAVHARFTLHTP